MFGKKKAKSPAVSSGGPRSHNKDLATMMGLGVPVGQDSDDEESYLAELAALEGKPPPAKKNKENKGKLVSMEEINRMAALGMKDLDDDDDDDDDEFDESELLAELDGMSGSDGDNEDDQTNSKQPTSSGNELMKLLQARKIMYAAAIESAEADGATSKANRFGRGLKEIDGMIKRVEKGGMVNENDIPPPVVVKSETTNKGNEALPPQTVSPAVPVTLIQPLSTTPPRPAVRAPQAQASPRPKAQSSPSIPLIKPVSESQTEPAAMHPTTSEPNAEQLDLLLERQRQFKLAALQMKQAGNMEDAKKYLATSKQFETVIAALRSGKEVNLSNMPIPPDLSAGDSTVLVQGHNVVEASVPTSTVAVRAAPSAASGPPLPPSTIMEALEQRLEKYIEASNKAKEEGNGGKARRMGRIIQQYQDAIKACKLKKPYDFAELPSPPGFGPIPGVSAANDDPTPPGEKTQIPALNSVTSRPPPMQASNSQEQPTATRNEKEYEFLINRQKEFKMAALRAKQSGDMETAREYLRQAKGFDEMILAAQNGMRVDVSTVPSIQPKANTRNSALPSAAVKEAAHFGGSIKEQYIQIENALRKQIETSENNVQHYKLLGNLDAAKNFEGLLRSSKTDLSTLLTYMKQAGPVPTCNYVMKSFPVVRSNPQLSDSELKLTIVRCVNIPLPSGFQPKDMHIYVTYEFPLPAEKPQLGNTTTKKESINPDFNEDFKLTIDRKNRSFVRFCKRQTLNVKVFYVKGFLKSDKAIGQANIKLDHFSNRCEIHESLDLVDLEKGRKSVGGKIEVILQIREPLVDKDAEIVKEKWLVLDTHLRGLQMNTPPKVQSQPSSVASYQSLEVLNQEKLLLEGQFAAYKSQGKQVPATFAQKLKVNQEKSMAITMKLKEGGKEAVKEYLKNLIQGLDIEKTKAQNALKNDDKESARNCLARKKLVEKEIGVLRQRLGI